jgi:hypothetical protein
MHERREVLSEFWSENVKGRYHSEDLDEDGRKILEYIGTRSGVLYTRVP